MEQFLMRNDLLPLAPHRPPEPERGGEEGRMRRRTEQPAGRLDPLAFVVGSLPGAERREKVLRPGAELGPTPQATQPSGCCSGASLVKAMSNIPGPAQGVRSCGSGEK